MSANKPLMNLSGAMDLIKMSKNPLAPVYEAITNSLEALTQVKSSTPGYIEVRLFFAGLFENEEKLEQIEIVDNGAGFNEENYGRFREFFVKSKGYDNRGTGRLQYFHRFHRVRVDSVFQSDEKRFRRTIDCHKKSFIVKESFEECESSAPLKTSVSLSEYSPTSAEMDFFSKIDIDDFSSSIRSQFLLRFYLDNKKPTLKAPNVVVIFFRNGEELAQRLIDPNSIPSPQKEGEIKVPYMNIVNNSSARRELEPSSNYEIIKWAHFVLPQGDLGKNGIYLCSKNIPVQSIRFEKLKKNEIIDGKRFLTAFYGEVLDNPSNVSDSVDSFTFPEKKKLEQQADDMFISEEQQYIVFDSIYEQVNSAIPEIYSDIVDVHQEQQKDVESIAKAHGIPSELIDKAKIGLSDNEMTITKKLYRTQSDGLAERSFKAKKLFESLNSLNPTDDDYQSNIHEKTIELSRLVEEQNKEELSRYVIRREMVTDILKKILSEDLAYQKLPKGAGKNRNREALVHDLVFKRKSKTTSSLNDLWILNEEFMHFEGCSDLPINQIQTDDGEFLLKAVPKDIIDGLKLKLDRRPDIFLYPSEGKCLLVEFKEPNVDMSDYLNQLPRYCTLIANFGRYTFNEFYCYLIGEKINPITDLTGDYQEKVNGDWLRPNIPIVSLDTNRNTIANAQIEIIKLSSIHSRAHLRNKSFASKLGIPELLKDDT